MDALLDVPGSSEAITADLAVPRSRSLPQTAWWSHVAPALQAEQGAALASGRRHRRIELLTAPFSNEQLARLLLLQLPCASCGAAMFPFRRRRGRSAGRAKRPGRLFVTVACPIGVSVACSRGRAASDATEALAVAILRQRQCASGVRAVSLSGREEVCREPESEPR
jgi:hypothetical protein